MKQLHFFTGRLGLNYFIHMDSFYNNFDNIHFTTSFCVSFANLDFQWRDRNFLGFIKK